MFDLCLIRHGDSLHDNLTPMGVEQMRLAAERWKKLWDGAKVRVFHSPTGRTKASAKIFSHHTRIQSSEAPLIAIAHYHDREKHRMFAEIVANARVSHIVLIGHDETRRVCDAILLRSFRRADRPPPVPQGGILRFVESHGYELV